jgi:biotin carboxyl carrier protein
MSTEPQVDPRLVEETRQQIRGLVDEIASLSKAGYEPQEYYREFLNRVVQALAAQGGVIWTTADGRNLELAYQIDLQSTGLIGDQAAQVRHGRVLHQVVTSGEGLLVAPHSGAGSDEEAGNPTDFLLVLAPLKVDKETRGVVEIFQRPGARLSTQRGYLHFLLKMCELVGDYLKTRQLRQFSDRQVLWTQLETFARMVHSSLNPTETAFTIANEGRRLIECDRVSVAIRKGRKCYVEAISGQDTFDKRSNTVTLLNRLSTAVVRTSEPMWYTGDTRDLPPQVEEAVQAYVDDSHSKTVAVLPLHKPSADDEPREQSEPIGALIVEQIENARPREGMQQRVDVVAQHSATALANALEHHNLFLMPLWRQLGRMQWVVQARTLPKTVAILTLAVALIGALFVIPADFELEGKGTLLPAKRRDVFAAQDGTVMDLKVKHGSMVKEGDLLARLRNTELDVQIADVLGKREESKSKIINFNSMLLNNKLEEDEKRQITGNVLAEEQKLASLQKQYEILIKEQKELEVHSPIAGQVITWDVEKLLKGRHVNRGQVMMEVADPSGAWELEVLMPEDRMGHIARARHELGDPLKVTYIMATDPDTEHTGAVTEIHSAAEVRGEEGNTVLLRVAINKEELGGELRSRAGLTARVYCGKRAIGYVWFHDLIDWVYAKIFFRL